MKLSHRFSLRTLFIAFTLAALTCGGLMSSGVCRLERVAVQGRGVRFHAGPLAAGWVDYHGDERGALAGLWYFSRKDLGNQFFDEQHLPLIEVELGGPVKLAGA